MVPMPPGYIHGTDPGEIARLEEQAEFLGEILLEGVELPAAPRRVLDLGCGVGAMTRRLIRKGASFPVGVDLSPAQAREGRRLTPRGRAAFLAADGAALPFPEGAFDLVYTSWFFEHLSNVPAVLAEVHRLLAPGGALWASEVENSSLLLWPRSRALEETWRAFNQAQIDCGGDPFIGRKTYSLLVDAGFGEIDVWPHTFHGHAGRPDHFALVVREFVEILRSGRESVVGRRLTAASTYDAAIRDLASLPEKKGATITYTFLRSRARKAPVMP
jgi:SAM-dependent methyltransferase